jgi:hypothetical protein
VSTEAISEMRDAGLFRIMQPAVYAGSAEPDRRHFEVAFSEFAFLYDHSFQSCVVPCCRRTHASAGAARSNTAKAVAARTASAEARKTVPSPDGLAINPKAGVPKPSATSRKAVYIPISEAVCVPKTSSAGERIA